MTFIDFLLVCLVWNVGALLVIQNTNWLPTWTVPLAVIIQLALICICMLLLSVLYVWRWLTLRSIRVDSANYHQTYAEVIGCRLVPEKGLVMDILDGEKLTPVLVNPNYWHLLPDCAISNKYGTECPVMGVSLSHVAPGKEPSSLVAISNGSEIIGFGSRVKFNGVTYLLTANHVWNGRYTALKIVKGSQEVSVDASMYTAKYFCEDLRVDFAMVPIPEPIWTKLGVKASNLSTMSRTSLINVYGGADPTKLKCSSAKAVKAEYSHQIVHYATTGGGWSGTPLYYNGAVVGMHTGSIKLGESNRGVNVAMLLNLACETVFSEITYTEIDSDLALDRDYGFIEVEIHGKGKFALGKGEWYAVDEFVRNKRLRGEKLWADMAEEDEPEELELYHDTIETILPSPLNVDGAESVKRSPPSSILAGTSGPKECVSGAPEGATATPKVGCLLPTLADRVLNLERLVEVLLTKESQMPSNTSQNSPSLVGRKEALKQSSNRSKSKPKGLDKPVVRKDSKKPVEGSKTGIHQPDQGDASEGSGMNAKQRRKLRRSAKAVSTSVHPPVSH